MDVLSDILNVLRLNGGAFFTAEFSAPWSVYTPTADELAVLMNTRAECIAVFHIFLEGECWIRWQDLEPFQLSAGSAIIFNRKPSHSLSSGPGVQAESIVPLVAYPEDKNVPEIHHGGGGDVTRFFCGFLQCDHRFNPVFGAMPALIIATPDSPGPRPILTALDGNELGRNPPYVVMPTGDTWLKTTLSHLVREAFADEPGSPAMLSRLTELFYVEILRRYIREAAVLERGWFAAMNDVEVGRALRLLHAQPGRKWTVQELAAEVGMSRSALAQRFADLVGESPMRYLTNWRMQRAKDLILRGQLSLPMIAEQVGYDSEVAFNRAFKREVGLPPASWREQLLA